MIINGIVRTNAEAIWIGCSTDDNSQNNLTAIYDALLSHPTIWYWPINLHVLFLGDKGMLYPTYSNLCLPHFNFIVLINQTLNIS